MDLRGNELGHGSSDDARFDASQYAFFGKDIADEVELGGLEEDDDQNVGFAEDVEFQISSMGGREELNNVGLEQRIADIAIERDPFLRESSSGADWLQDVESSDWLEQQILDADNAQKRWQTQQPSLYVEEMKSLQRTSTYPQQNPREINLSEPIHIPESLYTLRPSLGGRSYTPPNETFQPSISPDSAHLQMPFSRPNMSPFSVSQLNFAAQNRLQYNNNGSHFIPPRMPMVSQQRNVPLNHNNLYPGDQSTIYSTTLSQKLPPFNGLPHPSQVMNPQMLSPPEHHRFLPSRPSHHAHASLLHPQLLSSHFPRPPVMNKFDLIHGMADVRDERFTLPQRGSPQFFDINRQRNDHGWPQFKAKYMSAEEIGNIIRMQHAATHSNDPYVDDYYHQACLAKKSAGARLRHHFCPQSISDLSSRARANNEPHPYLHVDALGRIAFSSVRRPRPLLEVDTTSKAEDKGNDKKTPVKPLEEEPMLAARIAVEDGLGIILEVDDIDRILQFNQPPDGGSQLNQQRSVLLEGLAASLHLVDPFGPQKSGLPVGLGPKDDLVFLRIVSLPKGRKFLSRFLKLLNPGNELARVICMAIFRHLRFLFSGPYSEATLAETTSNLSKSVCFSISSMDLTALSACLAAIVCSSEKPPFRPIGGSSGDGASLVVKSVLDRATALLADPLSSQNLSMTNRVLWQESFNAFFKLLTDYCFTKYDSVIQSMHGHAVNSIITSDVSRAISKEMPIDLLRASLPHTDEQQRKLLLEFAQRSMPV